MTETSPIAQRSGRCINNHMVAWICHFSCFNFQAVFNSNNIELLISEVFHAINTTRKCWSTNCAATKTSKICWNSHWNWDISIFCSLEDISMVTTYLLVAYLPQDISQNGTLGIDSVVIHQLHIFRLLYMCIPNFYWNRTKRNETIEMLISVNKFLCREYLVWTNRRMLRLKNPLQPSQLGTP